MLQEWFEGGKATADDGRTCFESTEGTSARVTLEVEARWKMAHLKITVQNAAQGVSGSRARSRKNLSLTMLTTQTL